MGDLSKEDEMNINCECCIKIVGETRYMSMITRWTVICESCFNVFREGVVTNENKHLFEKLAIGAHDFEKNILLKKTKWVL